MHMHTISIYCDIFSVGTNFKKIHNSYFLFDSQKLVDVDHTMGPTEGKEVDYRDASILNLGHN